MKQTLAAAALTLFLTLQALADRLPNVVIIFTDDQGYGDVGCFGAKGWKTPNLDRMAAEGRRFTSFYVAQAVCGASRAALLTGCYPNRIGMLGAPGPRSKHGINDDEMLLSELVKQKGYATAIYGKWHLGDNPRFLPVRHGFDDYYGLPYSNDMWPYHPGVRHLPMEQRLKRWPHLPLIEDDKIIDPEVSPEEQVPLTSEYTRRAVQFIGASKDKPFLLYLAHSQPHVPLFVSDKFKGKSEQGLYGDVMMEIDWSVGEVLKALKENGVDEHTLVVFATDNGPWLSYGNHAGGTGGLREGKGTSWEGGVRVPCIMRWPGKIPAGTKCTEPAMTIDIVPTVAKLIDAKLPNHKIDGKDIWPLMAGEKDAKSPHDAYYIFWGNHLDAVRHGKWSLHLPHAYRSLKGEPGKDGIPGPYKQLKTGLALFDLEADVNQTKNIADQYPEIVAKIKAMAAAFEKDLNANKRTPGRL